MYYITMIVIALFCSMLYIEYMSDSKNRLSIVMRRLCVYVLLFSFLGAKVIGLFPMIYRNEKINLLQWFFYGDLVYYGGLYGSIIGINICIDIFYSQFIKYKQYFYIAIPLFHGISRIGCYLSGCCYGKTIGNTRIPVQLIESFMEIILFLTLNYIYLYKQSSELIIKTYVLLYSFVRFITEFFRGDVKRGVYKNISFGQVLSVINIVAVLIMLIKTIIIKKCISKGQ